MGCWGITAMESDAGLDAVGFIREHLPENGTLELGTIVKDLQQDEWNKPADTSNANSHTSPMALAEVMINFMDGNVAGMDYDGMKAEKENKFSAVTSFTASRESVRWLRDYLCDTLNYAMRDAENGRKWGGWFQEKDWIGWQNHMETLIGRLDGVLAADGNSLVLFSTAQEAAMESKQTPSDSGMTMK